MKKCPYIISLLLLPITIFAQEKNNVTPTLNPGESVTIPVKRIVGRGNLTVAGIAAPSDDTTSIKNLSVPAEVINYRILSLHFNQIQNHFYQYKKTGSRRDSAMYRHLLKEQRYDSSLLQSRKINEDIVMFYGKSSDGLKVIIVDANNNKDLTDDTVFRLPPTMSSELQETSLPVVEVKNVEYPTRDGIVLQHYYLKIDPYEGNAGVGSGFLSWLLSITVHEYREAFFRADNKDFLIRFPPPAFSDFYTRSSSQLLILPLKDSARKNLSRYNYCRPMDTITIDGLKFQPLSVSVPGDSVSIRYYGVDTAASGIREGMTARNFQVNDVNGETLVLSRVNAGKYVLLDFWGTWCKPCLDGIPELVATYQKLKPTNRFEFISIANDKGTDYEKMQRIVEKNKMVWLHVFEDSNQDHPGLLANQYKILSFPTGILINPEGKIVRVVSGRAGMQELMQMMIELAEK